MTKTKIYNYSPNTNQEVIVGNAVAVKIKGYNNSYSNPVDVCLAIARGDTSEILVHEVEENVQPRRATDKYSSSFVMPDNTVEVYFDVGWVDDDGNEHWEDEEITTLTPVTYTPKFKIRAMEDVSTPISGATVTVTDIGTKITDADGYTDWFYADYGTYLDVHITADGYEPYNTGDTFPEGWDGMIWTHYLTPSLQTVDFRIRVLDYDTMEPIANAYVDLNIGSDHTDANGYTKWWTIEKGYHITGTISADRYEDKPVEIWPEATTTWNQYLVPESIVTCDQLIKVVDEDGEIVENALIWAESETHGASCRTGANGEACSVELNEGEAYIANAIEYTTVTPAYFTACTGAEEEIVVERDYCNQKFLVLDQFDDGIEGAEVECKSLWHFNPKCTTTVDGNAGVNIKKDIAWTAVATKDGCECLNCEQDFTSCTSTITLTLSCPKGEIVSYSKPAELEEGEELTVSFIAKNIGVTHGVLGGFKMHLWIDGTKYDTEPDTFWKSLNHDETWEHEVNTIGALWSMPDHDVNVEIVLEDKYMGDQAIEEFVVTLKPTKKETRLECYDAETAEGSEATLEAKLEHKNLLLWHDLEGKQVNFEIDTVDAIFANTTDADGIATVTFPAELVPAAGTYAFTATFIEDGDYYGSTCEGTLTVTPVGVCEYTGHASDGKIDHDNVPSSAVEGSTVEGSVSVDCIEVGETRYRVKFVLDGGTPVYSGDFLLGYIGEQDVPFSFIMLDHDVTLIAEVERCNESGMWEACEHADHIKTYTIKLVGCEYTGYLCDGKIAEESAPESADEGDTVAGSVTIDNLCLGGSEHTRYRVKFTVDDDIVYSESFVLKATRLSILDYPYEMAVPFSFGMPDHSVNLIVEIERCNAASIWEPAGSQYKKTYTISLKGDDEVEYKKALAYGAAAVGMYTGGSLIKGVSPKAKAVGLGLKVGTLVPACLCGLETYKIIKEKIPDWLK